MRFAVPSDMHLAQPEMPDGTWNNTTHLPASGELLNAAVADITAAKRERGPAAR
jgi:hypothetical protein